MVANLALLRRKEHNGAQRPSSDVCGDISKAVRVSIDFLRLIERHTFPIEQETPCKLSNISWYFKADGKMKMASLKRHGGQGLTELASNPIRLAWWLFAPESSHLIVLCLACNNGFCTSRCTLLAQCIPRYTTHSLHVHFILDSPTMKGWKDSGWNR
jgi:hypothetical protein